MKREERL